MTKWLLSNSWYLLNPQLQQSFTYCAVYLRPTIVFRPDTTASLDSPHVNICLTCFLPMFTEKTKHWKIAVWCISTTFPHRPPSPPKPWLRTFQMRKLPKVHCLECRRPVATREDWGKWTIISPSWIETVHLIDPPLLLPSCSFMVTELFTVNTWKAPRAWDQVLEVTVSLQIHANIHTN